MSKLVLVVDDHLDNRVIYRSILVHLGYRVIEAAEGDAAIDLARSERPDLILMDMTLPGNTDGWVATGLLKKDPATATIPIIALTAHAFPEHRARATELGCEAFVAKPADPRQVAEEIRRLIGEPSA